MPRAHAHAESTQFDKFYCTFFILICCLSERLHFERVIYSRARYVSLRFLINSNPVWASWFCLLLILRTWVFAILIHFNWKQIWVTKHNSADEESKLFSVWIAESSDFPVGSLSRTLFSFIILLWLNCYTHKHCRQYGTLFANGNVSASNERVQTVKVAEIHNRSERNRRNRNVLYVVLRFCAAAECNVSLHSTQYHSDCNRILIQVVDIQ